MMSILKLAQGNIGSKGNTSCVWQQSKLRHILPNLPSECDFIVIMRQGSNRHSSGLTSTKFERWKIQEVLEILQHTVQGVWKEDNHFNIQYDMNRFQHWPESGDLIDLNPDLRIYEQDEEGNIIAGNELEGMENEDSENQGLVIDGDDHGPAPLQNNEAPSETFETVVNLNDGNTGRTASASLARNAIETILQNIRDGAVMSDGNTRATYQHNTVLSTEGFVNMRQTPYSWSRAFPTVFVPDYIEVAPGEWQWVILNDITGFHTNHDRNLTFEEWHRHLMWRSDGIPASHPTFSLVVYNEKLRNGLQKQGRYIINSSDIDPNLTVNQIRNAATDDTIQKQVDTLLSKSYVHAGNVPGTQPYWRSTRHEFKATTLFNSYVHKKDVALFHTGSIAEYHEYPLRLMLHNYVNALDGDACDIIGNDAEFYKAVQLYKNVVTHYLAAKMEI